MKKKAGLFIAISFEVIILLMVFVYIGQNLDRRFNTKGLMTALFVFFVMIVWFYQIIRLIRSFEK